MNRSERKLLDSSPQALTACGELYKNSPLVHFAAPCFRPAGAPPVFRTERRRDGRAFRRSGKLFGSRPPGKRCTEAPVFFDVPARLSSSAASVFRAEELQGFTDRSWKAGILPAGRRRVPAPIRVLPCAPRFFIFPARRRAPLGHTAENTQDGRDAHGR